jgi:hypothetical protein
VGSRSGIVIALGLGIVLALLLALGFTTGLLGGLASATQTPGIAAASAGASAGPSGEASGVPTPTLGATQAPTAAVAPTHTPRPSIAAGASGAPSTKPTLVSIAIPHKADCNGDDGTGTIGQITIAWSTTGATGVRISIDPPTASGAYGYGYQDYLAPLTSATVPFACGSPLEDSGGSYHLYVITTLHTTGYYQYRYQKVYQSPAPTP